MDYYYSPIGHSSNLITIIPPRHDFSIRPGIFAQPEISFTEIINDVLLKRKQRNEGVKI